MSIGHNELANRFGYHPATAASAPVHSDVRDKCLKLAIWLDITLPDGRMKSLALTNLEDVMYRANAAIAMEVPLSNQPQLPNQQQT